MIVRFSCTALLCAISFFALNSQNGYSVQIEPNGPPMSFYNVLSVMDTLYVNGAIKDPNSGLWSVMLAQIDTSGNLIKYAVAPDSSEDVYVGFKGNPLLFTEEGNFVFVSSTLLTNSGMLFAFDSIVNFKFKKEFQFDYPDVRSNHQRIIREVSGGYLIAGGQQREDYFSDMFVIKTDKQGNIVWYKTYGEPEVNEFCVDMQKINENLFVLAGAEYNSVYLPVDEKLYNSTLIYIDSMGNVIDKWDADTNSESSANNYIQLDNEFLYSATTREIYEDEAGDLYFFNIPIIVKRDSGFKEVWKYTIDCEPVFENVIFRMEQLSDGNFLAVGKWALPEFLFPGVEIHGCMLKISPDGEKIWSRCDTVPGYSWGYNKFWLCGVTELSSGSIVAAGGHDDTQLPGAKSYGWLVKVDKDGCMVDTLCTTTSLYEQILEKVQLMVSPNPASERFTVSAPDKGILHVFTVDGRLILRIHAVSGKNEIHAEAWEPGMYLLSLKSKSSTYTGKVILN